MKPTRRTFQFSLRAFLVLFAALAVWLGWQANRLRRQAEAVRVFQQAGCVIGYRVPPPRGQKIGIEVFAKDDSWRDFFRVPTDLVLKGDLVDDDVCRSLDDLGELLSIELREDTRVTGAAIERIGRLRRLEIIFIHDPDITAEDVEKLSRAVPAACEILSKYTLPGPRR
jgi:hypothetical protein